MHACSCLNSDVAEPFRNVVTRVEPNVTTILMKPGRGGNANRHWDHGEKTMANVTLERAKRQAIAGLAGCALLSGLALDAARAPANAADQVKIGISRAISDAGYYMADAMGFFRDEGIDVSITGFNSAAQMIAPLGTGELDVGGGTVSAGFYNAGGGGVLMKIVADQASIKPRYGYSPPVVGEGPLAFRPHKRFARLKGTKGGGGGPGDG